MENKISILIDGGFYTQRFKELQKPKYLSAIAALKASTPPPTKIPKFSPIMPTKKDVESLIIDIMAKVQAKTKTCTHHLLRSYYYDSLPFAKTITDLKGNSIDYSKSPVYVNQTAYIESLKTIDQFALRLGELSFSGWKLDPHKPSAPAKPDFRQKGVDMKIGLDIAWMSGKQTVDAIVLVTGDSDFIAPMKLARREGILIYLYPMGQTQIKLELKEHSDFIL